MSRTRWTFKKRSGSLRAFYDAGWLFGPSLDPRRNRAQIAGGRQATKAFGLRRRAHDRFGQHVGGKRTDNAGVGRTAPASGREREDSIAVTDRMGGADRPRKAI